MKRASLLLIIAALMTGAVLPAQAGLFGDPAKGKIQKVLRSPALATANIGIKVVDLSSGKTLFSENSGKLFIPASTVKLLTAYAALKTLGPDYVFRTEFAADAPVTSGTVHTLSIRGYGDPSVTLADINLQAMTLADRINGVSNGIVVDTSFFDCLQFGRGWMWDEGIVSWNAPIAPYAVQGDCVDIYVRPATAPGEKVRVRSVPETAYAIVVASAVTADADSLRMEREEMPAGDRFVVDGSMNCRSPEKRFRCTVSRPGLYAATLFKELLIRYGVAVKGEVFESRSSTRTVTLANFSSRNLADIIRFFLKESDNLTGECILKTMGAACSGEPGSAEKGIAVIKGVLRGAGVKEQAYALADGSGLSTYNQLSPDILTTVLRAAYADLSLSPELLNALSVAGRDGTLRCRLAEPPLAAHLRAKTGTMSGVSCLAGYLQARSGRILAVTVMMNGFAGSAEPLRAAQDEIIKTLWANY